MLALPAESRRFGERLLHHRRSIDEDLNVPARRIDQPARQRLEVALHEVVIVSALRIDRDAATLGPARERKRVGRRRIAHAERDHRPDLGPQTRGRGALLGARLHPQHVAMRALSQPFAQPFARLRSRVRARDAASGEAQPLGFRLERGFEVGVLGGYG